MKALYITKIFAEMSEEGAKLERDNTMVATAKVSGSKTAVKTFLARYFTHFPFVVHFRKAKLISKRKAAWTKTQKPELNRRRSKISKLKSKAN